MQGECSDKKVCRDSRLTGPPGAALADSGFFSIDDVEQMELLNI
jgi:hypothetical protein